MNGKLNFKEEVVGNKISNFVEDKIEKLDRNIGNPVRTGFVKGSIQFTDMLAHPRMEELAEQYDNDPEKIYEAYKKETENNRWKNSSIRTKGIEYIKKNREERQKFLDNSKITDKGITFGHSVMEGIASPLNWFGEGIGLALNLAIDIIQGFVDTTWEKTEIEGKKIEDFDKDDWKEFAVGAGTTIAVHGITRKISKHLKKKNETKIKNNEPAKTPLERLQREVEKHGVGATEPSAVIELAERMETGETVGLERNKNFAQEVDDFYTNITEKRLEKINKEDLKLDNTVKNKQSNAEFIDKITDGRVKEIADTKGDIYTAKSVSKTLKPLKTKIKLNSKQIQGEYTGRLAMLHMENGGSGNFRRIGDLNEVIVNEYSIDGKLFKKMIRGDVDLPEHLLPYADEYRKVANEYTNLKYGSKLSNKGYNFDIVYDKNNVMSNLKTALDIGDLETEEVLVEGILKNKNKKVYLSEKQANSFGVGDKAGLYTLSNNKLIEKLKNDINGTTLDIKRYGDGKIVDFESKTWLDVAAENAPFKENEAYFKIKDYKEKLNIEIDKVRSKKDKLKKTDFSENKITKITKRELGLEEQLKKIDVFIENYENKALAWLDGVLDEMNAESDPVMSMNRMYKQVIDEKSGFNVLKYRLGGNLDSFQAEVQNSNTGKMMFFQNNKSLRKSLEDELNNLGSIGADVSLRKYSDMSFTGKTIYNVRNTMMYKYLSNLNYLKEIATNKERINSGAIDLGFNKRVSFFESAKEMTRATKNVVKKYKNLKDIDLKTIANPLERLQLEAYIDKIAESEINMSGHKYVNLNRKLGDLGAKGQTASDVKRIALSEWFTVNAMYDEFTKMEFDNITPTMRQTLLDLGINDSTKLRGLQEEILNTKSVIGLLDKVKDRTDSSTIKQLFSQFADINGRVLNAFENAELQAINGPVDKLWLNFNKMFRGYNMNNLGRLLDKLTTYMDDDGLTRYRFFKDGQFSIRRESFTGLREWRNASRFWNSSSTALQTAGMVYAVKWGTGKITGTTQDEMVETKIEALMHGELGDTVLDVITTGLIDNTGLEIALGGENIVSSFFRNNFNGLKRASSSSLSPVEKIIYGSLYIASPNAISRGIDNRKFEKNIPSRITTSSEYTKELWKYKYKDRAEAEQAKGLLPIEKVLLGTAGGTYEVGKKLFDSVLNRKTDYETYYNKYPEQTERFADFKENTPKEAKVALASGIMELAEYGARSEKLDEILSTVDSPDDREKELAIYGMDYKSQLKMITPKNRTIVNSVLAFAEIESPETVILFLNEFNELKTKEERTNFAMSLIHESRRKDFIEFLNKVKNNKDKRDEIVNRGYQDNTEGYIEFLQALKNEI